jgi:hypothetical protein
MTMMKKNIVKLCLILTAACFAGCEKTNFLQDGSIPPDGSITEQQEWANPDFARNFLNNVYATLQMRYSLDGDGAMLASGSDEAVNSNQNSSINIFNNGTWSPVRTIDDVYTSMYSGIRKANIFLVKAPTSAIIPSDGLTFAQDVERLRGEAYFLRAFFEFELVKRYGSMVLVTKVLDPGDNLDVPRNSFDDCVRQISLDCDSAIARLPEWTQSWTVGSDRSKYGRATQTAALALKSRLLLYAASPQYNVSGDLAKWQAAADAAKALIDRNRHKLYTTGTTAYQNIFLWNVSGAAYNDEVIFATSTANNANVETDNAPISYDGATGRTNPTQELVNAFEMRTTGRPITDPTSGYSATNPYNNRDPRLSLAIMTNGSSFKNKTVETFVGGKDGLNANVNATKTGYYLRKFLAEAAVWNTSSNTSVRKPWIIFRYAETLLNYAEALNEVQGAAAAPLVLAAVNQIRARTGVAMPALQITNPAGNGYVAPTKEAIRQRIRNERRVELCFEEHRFFDVRRWNEGEITFNKPVSGMRITQTTSGVLAYQTFTVEDRVFTPKNYLFPMAQVELNKAPALKQNPGY